LIIFGKRKLYADKRPYRNSAVPQPARRLDPHGGAARLLAPGIDNPRAVGFWLEAVVRPAQAQADWEFQEVCLLRHSMTGFGVLPS